MSHIHLPSAHIMDVLSGGEHALRSTMFSNKEPQTKADTAVEANSGTSTSPDSTIHTGDQKTNVPSEAGLASFVERFNETWSDSLKTGDRTLLAALLAEENKYVAAEKEIAQAEADAKLSLADALHGQPNTPENQAKWLSLTEDLEPGPYAEYIIGKVGEIATEAGPVRVRLLETQQAWGQKYGDQSVHSQSLAGLRDALSPPGFLSRIGRMIGRNPVGS